MENWEGSNVFQPSQATKASKAQRQKSAEIASKTKPTMLREAVYLVEQFIISIVYIIYIFICVYSIKLVLLEVVCILVEHGCKKYMYNYVYIYTHVCIYIYMFKVYTAISFRPSKAPTCGRKNGCIGYSPRQSPRLRRTWRCWASHYDTSRKKAAACGLPRHHDDGGPVLDRFLGLRFWSCFVYSIYIIPSGNQTWQWKTHDCRWFSY